MALTALGINAVALTSSSPKEVRAARVTGPPVAGEGRGHLWRCMVAAVRMGWDGMDGVLLVVQEQTDVYRLMEKGGEGAPTILYVTPEKIAQSKRFMGVSHARPGQGRAVAVRKHVYSAAHLCDSCIRPAHYAAKLEKMHAAGRLARYGHNLVIACGPGHHCALQRGGGYHIAPRRPSWCFARQCENDG
jgi:hypothetical protein